MSESKKYVVLTEKEIKQKLAGYKSAYTKKVNAATSKKERKALEEGRDSYIALIESTIREENKKMIQRRAGHLSWLTRKANQEKSSACHTTTHACKSSKSSKKTCCCSVKVASKTK